MKYKTGIIGCGKILPRHLEAISLNSNFELISLCDIQKSLSKSLGEKHNVNYFSDYKEMIDKEDLNFAVIATPNSLHKRHAIYCLEQKCDVLIEKPVSFSQKDLTEISQVAEKYNQKAYCVLQVRLNPTISLVKKILSLGILGNLRSVSLIQRWQRPAEYFTGWRGSPTLGGGILYEVGIHYLDVLQYLVGLPKIHSSKAYTTKHFDTEIEDTVYSILDFGDFGGTSEVTISSEPRNLECSISLQGSNGFLKIGGKALNVIESANFLSQKSQTTFEDYYKMYKIDTTPNSYGSYEGSCPNHKDLYKNLENFTLDESLNVIKLIEEIYSHCNICYK